jgi:hypothetical protein
LSHDHCGSVRYNRGMLCKEKRAIGTVWVFRWSEEVNGQRRQHKDVIGTTKEFPTESAANKEADRLRWRLNENKQYLSLKEMTFGELINHYLDHELPRLSKSARKANKSYIKNWIEANWHGHLAGSMKTMQIQEWLDNIQRPDGTKLKIKNVLSGSSHTGSVGSWWNAIQFAAKEEVRAIAVLQPGFGKATEFQSSAWLLRPMSFVRLWSSCHCERQRWRS